MADQDVVLRAPGANPQEVELGGAPSQAIVILTDPGNPEDVTLAYTLSTDIALAATLQGVASGVGALTSVLPLLAAASASGSIVAGLTTAIPCVGSAGSVGAATGSLVSTIVLVGQAAGAAVAAGALTAETPEAALLSASLSGVVAALGGLSTAIPLVASSRGALVTQARLRKLNATWFDIPEFTRPSINMRLDGKRDAEAIMHIWSDTGVPARIRVWDETNAYAIGTSELVESTTPTRVRFDCVLSPGIATYRAQITSELAARLFAIGYMVIENGEAPEPTIPPPPTQPWEPPSTWLEYDETIPVPTGYGTWHVLGGGDFALYRWTGITAIRDGKEGPMAFGGDLHGDVEVTGAVVGFDAVAGAEAYRVYFFNGSNGDGIFEPHLNYEDLVSNDAGPLVLRYKQYAVADLPLYQGWPPPPEGDGIEYMVPLSGDADGIAWEIPTP